MRLACDSCGKVGPLSLETRTEVLIEASGSASLGHLVAVCAHCGVAAQVSVTRANASDAAAQLLFSAARPSSPSSPPASLSSDPAPAAAPRCPKCHAVVAEHEACPGCGLAAARMAGWVAARAAAIPAELHASWTRVTESWQDQPRHDAFVQEAVTLGAYAWAAGQYQDVRRQRPDDAMARRQLERVRRTAEAAMLASAAVRQEQKAPYRSATAILVMLVVVLMAGALYATFMRETRTPAGPATPVMPLRPGPARY